MRSVGILPAPDAIAACIGAVAVTIIANIISENMMAANLASVDVCGIPPAGPLYPLTGRI